MPNLDAEYRDRTSPVWDMSQERALLEQIVSQRIHFFLLFNSVLLAAAINARHQIHLQLVLTFGAAVGWFIALAFSRTLRRLDVALKQLASDPTHPFAIVNESLHRTEKGRPLVRAMFWIACFVINVGALGAWLGLLRAI